MGIIEWIEWHFEDNWFFFCSVCEWIASERLDAEIDELAID